MDQIHIDLPDAEKKDENYLSDNKIKICKGLNCIKSTQVPFATILQILRVFSTMLTLICLKANKKYRKKYSRKGTNLSLVSDKHDISFWSGIKSFAEGTKNAEWTNVPSANTVHPPPTVTDRPCFNTV